MVSELLTEGRIENCELLTSFEAKWSDILMIGTFECALVFMKLNLSGG